LSLHIKNTKFAAEVVIKIEMEGEVKPSSFYSYACEGLIENQKKGIAKLLHEHGAI
jgi:hypothetical protein